MIRLGVLPSFYLNLYQIVYCINLLIAYFSYHQPFVESEYTFCNHMFLHIYSCNRTYVLRPEVEINIEHVLVYVILAVKNTLRLFNSIYQGNKAPP